MQSKQTAYKTFSHFQSEKKEKQKNPSKMKLTRSEEMAA